MFIITLDWWTWPVIFIILPVLYHIIFKNKAIERRRKRDFDWDIVICYAGSWGLALGLFFAKMIWTCS